MATKGGTYTFVDGFISQLMSMMEFRDGEYVIGDHSVSVIAHSDQKLATDSSLRIPNSRMQELLWAQRSLPTWLRKNEFDAYHSLKHVGPLICPAQTVYRVPAVGQFDGSYPLSLSERFYWAHLAKRAYIKSDLLIAVSDYIRNGLIEQLGVNPEKVVTIHNGVNARFRQLDPGENHDSHVRETLGIHRPFVLSVGNVVPVKNVKTSLLAFSQLCKDRDFEYDFVVAGGTDYPHADELRQLGATHGIADRVHFIGFQSPDQLVQLYNSAAALIHTSFHEGFSLTILEAMACGMPIIASKTSSIPEAAGDAACYIDDPTDCESLANEIDNLLRSEPKRNTLSQAAIDRSRQFTWQACVEKTLNAYDRLTSPCVA
ncbi:MAG: glycosyltransferase family 4 protein [Planctomycetales bacterium]|nr:glycosyltransferase family 4 protein [Planctomycetales bacterium]